MTTGQSRLQWFGWLRWFLNGWIRAKVSPSGQVLTTLGIRSDQAICYVLKSNSIFDFLVLDLFCARLGLPRPLKGVQDIEANQGATSVYLSQVGILRTYGAYRHEPPSPFYKLLRRIRSEVGFDVQLVPVSVFWGRDPGRNQPSIFKLFFQDDDRASFFQKLFIVLAQGKSIGLHFSKPIQLRDQQDEHQSVEQTARKLNRVVRVHFQTLRTSVLGPGLISRNRIIETLIRGRPLKNAIADECRKKNISRDRAERLAKEYISEIAAEVSPNVIAAASVLLRRLWNKIYNGIQIEHIDRVKTIPANAEIVYVPCHRSHMDYLLLNYVLYDNRVVTPHVAAGINLNFWPVGSLLRRLGAFYIRRTFNNNRMYSVVFSEYVSFLIQKGFPLQFYPEGGRSRSGKLLQPKTGMLAMVVNSFAHNHDRPLYFVPVYIGYDRVVEVKTYRKELSGSKKKSESVGQLVQGRKVLRSQHGRAYLSFAEPINLQELIEETHANWRQDTLDSESKPKWLTPVVATLSQKVMTRINATAVSGFVSLVSLILLATKQRALPEEELVAHIEKFLEISKRLPYSPDVVFPQITARQMIAQCEAVARLSRFAHPGGDVIHAVEPQASYIVYYRNNIVHLFALPSVIAYFLQHNDTMSEDVVIQGVLTIYPILKKEFFLRWNLDELTDVVKNYVQVFKDIGLFVDQGKGLLTRPEMTSYEFNVLRTLGLVVGTALERFAIATHLLKQYGDGAHFKLEDFEKRCLLMAQRISLLTGASDTELASHNVFSSILEQLADRGYIIKVSENDWTLTNKFDDVFSVTSTLLSVDIRQSIARAKG